MLPRNALVALVLGVPLLAASAARAEESAKEIARKARDRGALNLRDLTAELKLSTTRNGVTKEQVLRTTAREINGRAHSLAKFLQPAGVAGVTVLTIEGGEGEPDDISIYLPKLKRVRKVARSQRGQSFMDTDFQYADLGGTSAEDEDLKRLLDTKVQGRDVYVLKGHGDEASPYGDVVMYVDKETFVPLQVDYEDKDGKPFKKYQTLKLKKFKDRVLAAESVMENLQSGSKTRMEILKIEEQTLGEEAFTERGLERG
ncbi:MAG: outer membrane lipoprotein-sorting protein [Myxococcaceae bacterium]|nr:outer membrane lipoprotein-sorting protein [Myxococcaceae bacterium]